MTCMPLNVELQNCWIHPSLLTSNKIYLWLAITNLLQLSNFRLSDWNRVCVQWLWFYLRTYVQYESDLFDARPSTCVTKSCSPLLTSSLDPIKLPSTSIMSKSADVRSTHFPISSGSLSPTLSEKSISFSTRCFTATYPSVGRFHKHAALVPSDAVKYKVANLNTGRTAAGKRITESDGLLNRKYLHSHTNRPANSKFT